MVKGATESPSSLPAPSHASRSNVDAMPAAMTTTAASTSTGRKSRPLRRKTSHSVIERRRREKINEGLVHLQRIVPACRDELRALLLAKAQGDKRLAARLKQQTADVQGAIQEHVNALLEEKIAGTQMVLEKLCIISHTVDYVEELQQTLKAYEHTYGPPPTSPSSKSHFELQQRDRKLAHAQAHLDDAEDDDDGEDSTVAGGADEEDEADEESESRPNVKACYHSLSSPEQLAQSHLVAPAATISRAKRQRHWGSNAPLDLNKANGYKRPRSISNIASAHSFEHPTTHSRATDRPPKRKAAPLPHSMRESSKGSEKSQEEGDSGEEDEGSESDLALDDWQESRPSNSHATAARVSPTQPFQNPHPSHHHYSIGNSHSFPSHAQLQHRPSLLYLSKKTDEKVPEMDYYSATTQMTGGADCDDCDMSTRSTAYGRPVMGPALSRSMSAHAASARTLAAASKRETSPSDRLLARPHALDVLAQVSGATVESVE